MTIPIWLALPLLVVVILFALMVIARAQAARLEAEANRRRDAEAEIPVRRIDVSVTGLSHIRELMQKYHEANGDEAKYLRGRPSLVGLGQLAAEEFGLEWQSDPRMPWGKLMVAGDG